MSPTTCLALPEILSVMLIVALLVLGSSRWYPARCSVYHRILGVGPSDADIRARDLPERPSGRGDARSRPCEADPRSGGGGLGAEAGDDQDRGGDRCRPRGPGQGD